MTYSLVWWNKSPDTWDNDTKTGESPSFTGETDLKFVYNDPVSVIGKIISNHGDVKYRIYLNNNIIYEQTDFTSSPINVNLTIDNEDMKIGINTIRVEFETHDSPTIVENLLVNKIAHRLKQNYGLVWWDKINDEWDNDIAPVPSGILIFNNGVYKSHDRESGWIEVTDSPTEQDYLSNGMGLKYFSELSGAEWEQLEGEKTLSFYSEDNYKTQVLIETETEPFTIYDEMGDSMEVLYYTDDEKREEAELHIEANYSPLDEFEEFEVVTWTDDADEDDMVLEMNALPKPQFIYQTSPASIRGYLQDLDFLKTDGEIDKWKYRVLLSTNKKQWKTWSGEDFVSVDDSDISEIVKVGMTLDEVSSLTVEDWEKWTDEEIYIGIYIDENSKTNKSYIGSITINDLVPTETTKVSDAKLYILNTKSTIDVSLEGTTLTGVIDDEDLTKVQYRVLLNDEPFYPADGEFTDLEPSPLNISITLTNKDYLIDENNVLRVEFHDYWGSTDYWETNFIGKYSGLLFVDETGEYYSTEIGEVLKYLDFGVIIAGQTTLEQKVILKNTYGYPVKNINIRANQNGFPAGVKAQFGTSETTFEALDELLLTEELADGEEREFYIRLTTQLGVTPNANGQFDIIVTADKV